MTRTVIPVRALGVALAAAIAMTMMLSTGESATGAPLPVVEMAPALKNVSVGDGPFNVTIEVKELQHEGQITYDLNNDEQPDVFVPSIGLAAFTFTIQYDPSVLEFHEAHQGPDLGKTGRFFSCFSDNDVGQGAYTYACASQGEADGLQGSAVLARVAFTPIGEGESLLELTGELSGPYSDDIPAEIKGAIVLVDSDDGPEPTDPPALVDPNDDMDGDTIPNGVDDTDADGLTDAVDPTPYGDGPPPGVDVPTGESTDDGNPIEVATPPGPDNPPQGDDSSGGDGNSFTTTLLIALGVFAGAGVLGTAGYAAWRVRRG